MPQDIKIGDTQGFLPRVAGHSFRKSIAIEMGECMTDTFQKHRGQGSMCTLLIEIVLH